MMQYYTNRTNGKKKVNGEKLESKLFPQFDFFYYVSSEGIYYICELHSGFSVGQGNNLNDAKLNAVKKINENGIDIMKKCLSIVMQRYGRINIKRRRKQKMVGVVHCKKDKYDVYIGRPGKWGNPFSEKKYGRSRCILMFEEWIKGKRIINQKPPTKQKIIKELKGKVLGCWCAPKACHGEVLYRIANKEGQINEK